MPASKLNGNDVLELWHTTKQDAQARQPHVFWHDRQAQDVRAKMVFDMLRSWGLASYPHAMLNELGHDKDCPAAGKTTQALSSKDLVVYACELVDAAWNELKHRGWIIELPPFNEIE